MTRQEKTELVDYLTEEFTNAPAVIFCDYKGMTVSEMETVRIALKKDEIKAKVMKNTLALVALEKAGKSGLELKDMNIALWGDDLVSVAKSAIKVEKDNEKLEIRIGYIDGESADSKKVEAYSKLPGKEELMGMLLSTWTAPARNFVYVLSGVQREFVTVLEAIREQKEQTGA